MIIQKEKIGDCILYLGDCAEIIPTLKRVDALITDPPYGIMLGANKTKKGIKKSQATYEGFYDTPEYVKEKAVPAIKAALELSKRGFITPGNKNMFLYPPADDVGVWFNPAGAGTGKWGFILAHMILYYGNNPRAAKAGNGASSTWAKNDSVKKLKYSHHPCPKPLQFMKWAVHKASLDNETVLDPFMGSGTTGVACVESGRRFIGIEINKRYFDLACKRIRIAAAQGKLDFGNKEITQKNIFETS